LAVADQISEPIELSFLVSKQNPGAKTRRGNENGCLRKLFGKEESRKRMYPSVWNHKGSEAVPNAGTLD
jgi:hypothetical protein